MLPTVASPGDLARLRVQLEPWRPALETIATRHGLAGAPAPEPTGTQPVFLFPDAVVKLYAPGALWGHAEGQPTDCAVERAALALLADVPRAPVPAVLGEGALEDWGYLVQSRARGAPLEQALSELSAPARLAVMRDAGRAVAAIHQVDAAGFTGSIADFGRFLDAQACDVREGRRPAVPEAWRASHARFVASTPRGDTAPVLLHTELGPGHVLVARDETAARVAGIIDWAEAMVGDREYDLAAVAFFVARGDGELFGAFLDGYGWEGPRGEALARRLLRYLLLHRYAPFEWLMARRPVPEARRVEDLVVPWMGVASRGPRDRGRR